MQCTSSLVVRVYKGHGCGQCPCRWPRLPLPSLQGRIQKDAQQPDRHPLQAEGPAKAIANMESAMEHEVPEGGEPKSDVVVVADLFSLKNVPPAHSLTSCVVLVGAILCNWSQCTLWTCAIL